jgi:multidrug transporter EmrE-like cation transporter
MLTAARYARREYEDKVLNAVTLALILCSVCVSAVAQMFLKIGVGRAGATDQAAPTALFSMLSSPMVIVGLGFYGFGALLWLFVLTKVELSAAYPFVGAGFIVTAIISATILGEHVSLVRLAGTLLIAVGCVIVARSV